VIASQRQWWSLPARRYRLANRIAFQFADCVIANSSAVGSSVPSRGAHRLPVAIIPNFVDDVAFAPWSDEQRSSMLRELGVPNDAIVIGVIANLSPVKDHATLLRAMAMLAPNWPSLHLVLVGDGECREALASLARTLDLERRVHFAGRRSNERNLHHLFDLSILCSLSEGFPNSIIEAMAAGKAVVATEVGGVAEAVVHGETGLLVPPSSPARLASALDELLRDPRRRATFGAAALDRARRQYQAAPVVGSLEALYERLLKAAGLSS
jgi:glycosyltransferase involved in cell wall biosynthesis